MKEKNSLQNGKKICKDVTRNKEDGVHRHEELSVSHNKQAGMPWAASGKKLDMITASEVRGPGRGISIRYRLYLGSKNGPQKEINKIVGQFSSVTQSCPTLCDPMKHSMPGLPVHHQLPESTQTHVH